MQYFFSFYNVNKTHQVTDLWQNVVQTCYVVLDACSIKNIRSVERETTFFEYRVVQKSSKNKSTVMESIPPNQWRP